MAAQDAIATVSREADRQKAPPADRFSKYPASWYLFCSSRQLKDKPISKRILGRELVAFRTASGRLVMMDARCSHLGADLGGGRVVGEAIQCPFHHWVYGPDGRCTHIPKSSRIPSFARQVCYPVEERHAFVFFFNGPEPLFPLPFFFDEEVEYFSVGRPFPIIADCTWYMLAAHGYDTQHFYSVHGRKLLAPLKVDSPSPFARRSRYTAAVVGNTLFDRLLRPFAGRIVDISITTWGGSFILITGTFGRVCSYFLIATQPIDEGKTLCEVIVFAKRSRNPLIRTFWAPVTLWLRRVFTRGYIVHEIQLLGNPQYRPNRLIDSDQVMIDYFHWAASLK